MIGQRMRTGTFLSPLICCAVMVLPTMSAAQSGPPGEAYSTVPAAPPAPVPAPMPATDSTAPASAATAPETIEIQAPRLFKFETQPPNGTLQKASLEGRVSYADLDLRTDDGVAELNSRIAQEAANICAQLAQIYPVYAAAGSSCVKDAIQDGSVRASCVIAEVRQPTSY